MNSGFWVLGAQFGKGRCHRLCGQVPWLQGLLDRRRAVQPVEVKVPTETWDPEKKTFLSGSKANSAFSTLFLTAFENRFILKVQ